MYVAKLSLSQRSFHHLIVTRLPNHMWAISCRITSARVRRWFSVGGSRKISRSECVTAATFSIAPALNSGTKTWSYFPNG